MYLRVLFICVEISKMVLLEESNVGVGTHNLLHANSVMAGNFNHKSPIPIEESQLDNFGGYVRPVNGVNDHGPYEFIIEPVQNMCLQMGTLALYCKVSIHTSQGESLTSDNSTIGPVNLFGSALWKQIDIKINDMHFTGSLAMHANYKAVLETLMSYEDSARDTHLKTALFELDTPGHFEKASSENKGHEKRSAISALSKPFEVITPLAADFLRSDNHLAPGNKLSITLTKASDNFTLFTNTTDETSYKIKFHDIKLYFNRIQVTPPLALALETSPQRYMSQRTELKAFPLPLGLTTHTLTLYSGKALPKHIVIAMVETSSFEGKITTNPFHFQHFGVSRLNLRLNGRSIPSDSLTPDFENDLFLREYHHLFLNSGTYRIDRGNCITKSAFKNGLTLFPFDLTPDYCNGFHSHIRKDGILDLEITWKTSQTTPITILSHASFEQVVYNKGPKTRFESYIF